MSAPQLPPRADELGLCLCHVCGKVCTAPRLGIVFFGFVVVLTMLAAMSFDPRLIWDAEVNDDGQA